MYQLNYSLNRILKEEDDAIMVQLWAKKVKEHVLAVALIKLADHVLYLIEHGEDRGGIRLAGDHASHVCL